MAINFPASPANNQVYVNPTTSTQYVYVSTPGYWKTNLSSSSAAGGASVYSANIGNASANTFTVTHSLDKANVVVSVRENSSGYYVYPDIKYSTANAVIVEFVTAPTTNQYKVIVLG